MMICTDTEERSGLAIYWFGTQKDKRQVGVCFDDGNFNIHNQGLAESLVFANDLLTDMVEKEL